VGAIGADQDSKGRKKERKRRRGKRRAKESERKEEKKKINLYLEAFNASTCSLAKFPRHKHIILL
jgi:hypothetical protein